MSKFYTLLMALLVSMALTANAQTLIDAGFEDVPGTETTTALPGGW